jgi:hypothetical protein
LRRVHRWLGTIAALFVLILSATGIALNHSSDWDLDSRYVSSGWLLDAYGFRAPEIGASFVDRGYRVTLLGGRLYLGEREIAEGVDVLTGLVALDPLLLVTSRQQVLLFTVEGDLVERMSVPSDLQGPVERAGRAGNQAVIAAAGRNYGTDSDVSRFVPLEIPNPTEIDWSVRSAPPASLVNRLKEQYRGRGLSIGRVIADVHSGRVIGILGPFLMDAVAILLIVLSLSGLLLWLRPRGGRRT